MGGLSLELRVGGLGFRVSDFGVWGLGFRVRGLGFGVYRDYRVLGLGFRVSGNLRQILLYAFL